MYQHYALYEQSVQVEHVNECTEHIDIWYTKYRIQNRIWLCPILKPNIM